MQRREFIKQLLGTDYKNILKWTALFALLYILLSVDFNNISIGVFSSIRLLGTLLLFIGAVLIVLLILAFVLNKILKLLPVKLVMWFKRNSFVTEIVLTGFLIIYFVYIAAT